MASSITVVSILTGIGGTGATKKSRVRKVSRWYVSLSKHDESISRRELNGEMNGHAGTYDMNFK